MSNYIPPVMPAYAPPAAQDAGTVMQLSAPIYQAKGWLKFLGVLSIIGGIFQILSIVGIISGGLSIWMGTLLTQAGSSIEGAAQIGDKYAFLNSMNGIKTYFTIQGVLTLIAIISMVLMICVMVVLPLLGVFPFLISPDIINEYLGV